MTVTVKSPTLCAMTRTGELLDIAALARWLHMHLPPSEGQLTAEPIGAGLGVVNALFLLRRGEDRWVPRLLRVAAEFAHGQRR